MSQLRISGNSIALRDPAIAANNGLIDKGTLTFNASGLYTNGTITADAFIGNVVVNEVQDFSGARITL